MPNHFDYPGLLDAIEADLDYHLYPTAFTLEQIRLGDEWLKEAAFAVLADSGFFPSKQVESDLVISPQSTRDSVREI